MSGVRPETRNTMLEARMRATGMTAADLAQGLNDALQAITGRPGSLNDRAVRRYLSGQTRWPQGRQRLALEAVFNCSVEELGFTPPHGYRLRTEDEVRRRSFLTDAAGTAAGFTVSGGRRVGRTEVQALEAGLAALVDRDNRDGGDAELEIHAAHHVQAALDLVRHRSSTETIRRAVYSTAAGAAVSAAWAAIDSGHTDRAQHHLNQSLTLAGLAHDSVAVMQTWNNLSMLGYNRQDYVQAAGAAEVGRGLPAARVDALYASLAYARTALTEAARKDATSTLRALGRAERAMDRARDRSRPAWIGFYDIAELHGLAALAFTHLGRAAEAEKNAHIALTHMKPELVRNRAHYTVILGLAQLRQGELELALSTVNPLFSAQLPGSARVRLLMRTFRREAAAAGSAIARGWLEQADPLTT